MDISNLETLHDCMYGIRVSEVVETWRVAARGRFR